MAIVNRVSKLQAFDAGPLAASGLVESLTPLLLNIARYNKMQGCRDPVPLTTAGTCGRDGGMHSCRQTFGIG